MPLASQLQDSFDAGMYRGRRPGPNAAYDIVNGLINADRQVFKRGGTAYQSTSDAGATLLALADVQLAVGRRTVFGGGTANFYVLDTNDATPINISSSTMRSFSRPAGLNGLVAFPANVGGALVVLLYGGSRKTSGYATGTVSVTAGGTTVTGVGTSWTANVDPGMIFGATGGNSSGVVLSVTSNTVLRLVAPWAGTTVAGATYGLDQRLGLAPAAVTDYGVVDGDQVYVAAVGASPRLLICTKQRIFFTPRSDPFTMAVGDYHELPAGVAITGATAIGDTAIIFTTAGTFAIENMSLDAVDDFGNVQHQVSQINELVLWGDAGITTWGGALLVPAVDDVYLAPLGVSPQSITGGRSNEFDDGIRVLYRGYVASGYTPGTAAVHRGHLFLPILNGTTWVDTLVCNLAAGFIWTRFSGHAGSGAYAQSVSASTRTPKLLGISAQRVTNLTGCFDPVAGNSADADATIPSLTVITRDYPLSSGGAHGFCQRIRVRAEVTDDANGGTAAAAATIEYSSDADSGAFTALTERGEQEGGTGWATSTGAKYWFAICGKRRERIRFRLVFSGGTASTILRSIELLLRPTGKT